jgi:hypothetical protein
MSRKRAPMHDLARRSTHVRCIAKPEIAFIFNAVHLVHIVRVCCSRPPAAAPILRSAYNEKHDREGRSALPHHGGWPLPRLRKPP